MVLNVAGRGLEYGCGIVDISTAESFVEDGWEEWYEHANIFHHIGASLDSDVEINGLPIDESKILRTKRDLKDLPTIAQYRQEIDAYYKEVREKVITSDDIRVGWNDLNFFEVYIESKGFNDEFTIDDDVEELFILQVDTLSPFVEKSSMVYSIVGRKANGSFVNAELEDHETGFANIYFYINGEEIET